MSSDHSGSPQDELIDSMLLAIDENDLIREIGSEGTCVHGSTSFVVGPWDRHLCAQVLTAWARAGWVGLYDQDHGRMDRPNPPPAEAFRVEEPDILRSEVAERILADPSAWTEGTWSGDLCLFENSDAPSDDEYRRVARAAMETAGRQ